MPLLKDAELGPDMDYLAQSGSIVRYLAAKNNMDGMTAGVPVRHSTHLNRLLSD